MPCNCDHLKESQYEIESRRVRELIREANGKMFNHKNPITPIYGDVSELHNDTAWLCEWCKSNDVSSCSLEMQIWWRDHQTADRAREQREADERSEKAALNRARMKLKPVLDAMTPEERDALRTWGINR